LRQSAQDVVDEGGHKEAERERNNQREVVHGRPCPREGFLRLFLGGFLVFFFAMKRSVPSTGALGLAITKASRQLWMTTPAPVLAPRWRHPHPERRGQASPFPVGRTDRDYILRYRSRP
jgi:hypothetical protein